MHPHSVHRPALIAAIAAALAGLLMALTPIPPRPGATASTGSKVPPRTATPRPGWALGGYC